MLKAEAGKCGQQSGQTGEIGESRYTASNQVPTRLDMAEQVEILPPQAGSWTYRPGAITFGVPMESIGNRSS